MTATLFNYSISDLVEEAKKPRSLWGWQSSAEYRAGPVNGSIVSDLGWKVNRRKENWKRSFTGGPSHFLSHQVPRNAPTLSSSNFPSIAPRGSFRSDKGTISIEPLNQSFDDKHSHIWKPGTNVLIVNLKVVLTRRGSCSLKEYRHYLLVKPIFSVLLCLWAKINVLWILSRFFILANIRSKTALYEDSA